MLDAVFCASLFALFVLFGQSCTMDGSLKKWAEQRVNTLGGCQALGGDVPPRNASIPNVKLFLYHNDEDELIADFLQYHSYVFGAKNIVIIDQDSQIPPVCKTLALFQHCGTKIITTTESFTRKGGILSREMLKYENTQSLLIPLDTDEFIFPFAKNSTHLVDVNREDLWAAFRALPIDGRKYKFKFYTAAHPKKSDCLSSHEQNQTVEYRRAVQNEAYFRMYAPIPGAKSFFHSDGFIRTDDGNHIGLVKHDNATSYQVNQTNIQRYFTYLNAQLVHFAIGSYKGTKDKYVRASQTMGYNGDTNCTVRRPGGHYCALCKNYINGTDHGVRHYTQTCISSPHVSYNYSVIADWFKKHVMSMSQLIGLK